MFDFCKVPLLMVIWLSYLTKSSMSACVENEICDESRALVCRNSTCVSACSTRGMQECTCDSEDDDNCYLCCGNSHSCCKPAHQYDILKSNGERWESDACAFCRLRGEEFEGTACDDNDPKRLCFQGKCSRKVCQAKPQGSKCDGKGEKICVDGECENPCKRFGKHLMVCECDSIDRDTLFASDDRCQLCCFDFNVKPASRRCQNAYRKYSITSRDLRPIWRVGLSCAGGKKCNRYGVCGCAAIKPSVFLIFILVFLAALLTSR